MKDWKGFLKKHFKQLIVVLLAIVIVVSYSLSRSSDRTLRAGGFPGEEQTEPGRDTESGEDSPDAAATAAAPLELVLDEPEETGEETPEESPGENTPEQEGESEQDLTAPEESVEEGPSGEEEESASGGQEESASDGQDDAGSGGQDESVSGGQDASVSGGESFVSGEDEDTAESVHADEAHDTDAGEAHGTGADEASANAEGSGANDGTDAGEASREAFFTTEDEGSAQDSGRESSEGESRETFFTTEDEDPAQDREDPTVFAMGGEDGDDASAAKTGREQTVFTMEDEAADDASAGKTGDAAEAADKASTGKTGDAAEAADKASTGRTGDAAGAGKTGSTAEAAEKDVRPAGVADTLVFKGPDYTVTATYGADAGIPAGASLVVFEIKEEEKAYQAYCDQAQAAVADSLAGGSGAGQGGSAQAEGSGAGSKAGTADSSAGTGTGSTESGDASKNASGEKGNNASSAEQAGTEAKSGRADAGNTGTASASAGSTGTTAAAAAGDKDVTVSWVRLFDITIEVDGKAVEPQGPVAVQIDYGQAIEQAGDEEVNTVHFEGREEVPVVLDTQTEGSGETLEQVNFETSGFSVFVVMGTKITKRILTSDGVGYLITLNCGPEAAVPADAELEVREIVSGTDEYEDYLARAKDAIREENSYPGAEADSTDSTEPTDSTDPEAGLATDPFGIRFARFFDIQIVAGGKTIEPAAPVQVTMAYADALGMEEEDTLCAVHFAKTGTQVIQASPDEDQKAVTFVQDSFSVTSTVVTNSGVWPASGSTSVMYVKSGNDYYAVAHDGGLHQVWLSGSSLIFPDDAEGFDISRYEWTYEQQRSYGWANHYLFYTDSRGARQYLDPSAPGGISSNAVSLSRDNSGKIYYKPNYGTSSYIGTGGDSLAGGQSSGKGTVIQFATDFSLPPQGDHPLCGPGRECPDRRLLSGSGELSGHPK